MKNNLEIFESKNTGGKAGKGFNKTETIQVIEKINNGYLIKKQFRYYTNDNLSRHKAIVKAEKYISDSNSL